MSAQGKHRAWKMPVLWAVSPRLMKGDPRQGSFFVCFIHFANFMKAHSVSQVPCSMSERVSRRRGT